MCAAGPLVPRRSKPGGSAGLALVLLVVCGNAVAASAPQDPALTKRAEAVRAPSGSIRIDGRLDEAVWETASPITDFVQAEPVEGAAPTDPLEVRVLYTDSALYIGAAMTSSGRVQAPLSRRDDGAQAESIQIELDTYLDGRTAYMFGVTAAGVRLDHYHPTDNERDEDWEYDPVWRAETATDAGGWTAELWVPFSQLRFNARPEQVWGLNILRNVPSRDEENYWVLVGRTQSGWASRFGELHGIRDIPSPGRLELLPYVAGSGALTGDRDAANPFESGSDLAGRVGMDVKYGLGPNLTLDVTVNPDFGQVEAVPPR